MSFANSSASNTRISVGDELPEIIVESLDFKALNGDKKLKLLSEQWPLDALPSSTSSLLSISSKQGLLAAAGPSKLVIAQTKAVRDALTAEGADDVRKFQPALEINVPKLSQVAFTADSTYLVICAEQGGGLAIYETQSLLQGKTNPAAQIPTNGTAVRALAPNPAPEFAHYIAVILADGKLLIADLRNQEYIKNGSGSPALKDGVAAVSWSNRGKQLTAGMADGNCFQLDHSGTVKAAIPAPPDLEVPCHVSSLIWLANDEWLVYHTASPDSSSESAADSTVHHIQSNKERTEFVFRKPSYEPVGNFGLKREPLTHYFGRLRNWHNLKDWIIVSSVVSDDTAIFSNSATPLTNETPYINTYTVTAFANDSSRLSLPLSVIGADRTTVIGMAVDLSSTDKVLQPIQGDEMDESPFPLPAVVLLNNEGVLTASWVIYKDALRNNHPCPDMASSSSNSVMSPKSPQSTPFGASTPAANSPAVGASGFPKPQVPAFGQATFGAAATKPAFGGASMMGNKQSVWGGGANATQPGSVFGQTSIGAGKPAFGSTSAFGALPGAASPFGATPAKSTASPFGAVGGGDKPASSGFGAYSGKPSAFGAASNNKESPFGAIGGNKESPFGQAAKNGSSIFGTPSTNGNATTSSFGMSSQPSFGSTVSIDTTTGGSTLGGKSVFGTPAQPSGLFGKPTPTLTPSETLESDMMDDGDKAPTPKEEKPSLFGMPAGGFKLGTTFKPGNQEDKEDEDAGKNKEAPRPKGLFGADFGAALGDAQKEREKTVSPPIKKEDEAKPSLFGIPAAKSSEEKKSPLSLFGNSNATPASTKSGFAFGKPSPSPAATPKDPLPPQVTSKPEPSPSTTTATSSEAKSLKESKGSSDGSHPLAGSEAEAIEMPESGDEDLDEESGDGSEEADDDEESEEGSPERSPEPPKPKPVEKKNLNPDRLPPMPTAVPKSFYDVKPENLAAPKPMFGAVPPAAAAAQNNLNATPLFGGAKPSTTPAGFPKPTQIFPPPGSAAREMPRSPSPIRSASTPAGRPMSRPSSRLSTTRPHLAQTAPPPPEPQKAPEPPKITTANLQDKEAERNQTILKSDLEPTLRLGPLITHQDYIGTGGERQTSVPAQIETLFRDINSMVDTLGLNARLLTEFIEGHNTLMQDSRSKDDLDDEDNDDEWCLVEVEDLMSIEQGLSRELDVARVEDRDAKVSELYSMRRDLVRTKNRVREMRRFLENAKDEGRRQKRRDAPLDKASEQRQREIKRDTAMFMKKLVEAEEAVSMLKIKIATSQRAATRGSVVPTVEAVENTVRKMTLWAEEKGADMDVLESQMKKLGILGLNSASSPARHGSPSASMRASTGFRRSGVFGTPSPRKAINGGGRHSATPSRSSMLGRTAGTYGVPEESESEGEEDTFVEVDPATEVLREMVEEKKRKTKALGRLRDAVRARGAKVTKG